MNATSFETEPVAIRAWAVCSHIGCAPRTFSMSNGTGNLDECITQLDTLNGQHPYLS